MPWRIPVTLSDQKRSSVLAAFPLRAPDLRDMVLERIEGMIGDYLSDLEEPLVEPPKTTREMSLELGGLIKSAAAYRESLERLSEDSLERLDAIFINTAQSPPPAGAYAALRRRLKQAKAEAFWFECIAAQAKADLPRVNRRRARDYASRHLAYQASLLWREFARGRMIRGRGNQASPWGSFVQALCAVAGAGAGERSNGRKYARELAAPWRDADRGLRGGW